ncbi:MAG: putative DNA binding domain-containing protein [Candidatus Aureabacteria bacterium]|nr:putative DNA binding domain-containing protein [Candidatus Auribacterota bacterium]
MKPDDLKLIIKEGEGLTVEFKEKYTSKIDRDIVSFSNTKGGNILLGISDDGKIVGEKLTNKLKAQINDLARKCEPAITVKRISQVDKVVVIEIEEGTEKPYSCSEGYFRRLDAVTQKMNQREVRLIFREAQSISFESLICENIRLSDLSLSKIRAFLKESGTSFKVSKANLESFLSSLGLYEYKKVNNAGTLMFASKIDRFIHYSEIILAAFKGKDKRFIYDRKDVRDDLLTQLNEAVSFIKKHLNVRGEIKGINRYDIYEIPLDALREAILNAIIHRDYSMRGTSIYVEIYDDRVVIVNPGGLPHGITKSNFGKESIRRNLIIADLFHRMGKVERIGSGIQKMRGLMKEASLKEPVFESETFFRAIFYRNPRYSLKGEEVGGGVGKKVGVKVGDKVTENQAKIMEEMKKNPYVSANELSKTVGISQRKIESNISKLKEKKLVKRIGSAKGGHWEVIKK